MDKLMPFHLAIPVHDIELCKKFYMDHFKCELGRESDQWVDLNFYGHQLVLHLDEKRHTETLENEVDGHSVPIPHFGVVLAWDDWNKLAKSLNEVNLQFIIKPYIRFEGQPGEQATMFFKDPSGNAIEFKSFKNIEKLFSK
jgi:extradiol dioxygenase family protein